LIDIYIVYYFTIYVLLVTMIKLKSNVRHIICLLQYAQNTAFDVSGIFAVSMKNGPLSMPKNLQN